MKPSVAGTSIFLAAIAVVISLIIYKRQICLNYKINATNEVLKKIKLLSEADTINFPQRDTLKDSIIALKSEKATYVELMDSHSNLIIGYVTLLFGLFAIAGLTLSNKLAKDIKDDYEKEKAIYERQIRLFRREQNNKYENHKKEILNETNVALDDINNSRITMLHDIANFYVFGMHYTEDHEPPVTYIICGITAVRNLHESYKLDKDESTNDSLRSILDNCILKFDGMIRNEENDELFKSRLKDFFATSKSILFELHEMENDEINTLSERLLGKLIVIMKG